MFVPERLEDGRIVVPKRAESEDGMIGDSMVPIGPDDPDYEDWDAMLKEIERLREEDPVNAEVVFGPDRSKKK